jgi:hypothetical protein
MSVPVVKVKLIDANGNEASFTLSFYGVPFDDFMATPGGGHKIREVLERRGLADRYVSSPFHCFAQRYGHIGRGR